MTPLTLISGDSRLILFPERGAIITSIILSGQEILYPDMLDETLLDRSRSVRGGIPILFPHAGPLTREEQDRTGFSTPQHGFARDQEFEVIFSSPDSVTFRLRGDQLESRILAGYPSHWVLLYRVQLSDGGVEISLTIENTGETDIPLSLGLHPYFWVPTGEKSQIIWDGTGGDRIVLEIGIWENGGTTRVPLSLTAGVEIPQIGRLDFGYSSDFRHLHIWSLPDRDFVCIEPLQGAEGAIALDPPPLLLAPSSIHTSSFSIHLRR